MLGGGTRYIDTRREHDAMEAGYPKLTALLRSHDIPYVVEEVPWQQKFLFIPSVHKMRFLEALDREVSAAGG